MSYQVFGRAIKNEYLSLGTIITAAVVAYGSMSGGKKEAAPSGSSLKETIEKAKETIPLGAGSSEEEQFIKNFIAEEEKKAHH
ncbi:deoxyribose-phosphate aldolase [Pyrrhoderma noxium]|uniref:Deoxyribose-phosphate aldolase n=1 Tax=Pyrrhoderma noxium TaxID=2282107 RepID=A0A286ULK3_9AGAM|nr:deoxyribose-phosphate aldolase [Pyrrhoderma noxium]